MAWVKLFILFPVIIIISSLDLCHLHTLVCCYMCATNALKKIGQQRLDEYLTVSIWWNSVIAVVPLTAATPVVNVST